MRMNGLAMRACLGRSMATSAAEICRRANSTRTQMPKMKTKSSTKKRFKVSGSGKIMRGKAFRRHNLDRRSKKVKRQSKRVEVMNPSDAQFVRRWMPYSR
jgi:large subunit ribosomal protein L35